MKVNMILEVYKTSNASKRPKRLKKNLEKKKSCHFHHRVY